MNRQGGTAYMAIGQGFPGWPEAIELRHTAHPADGRRRYVPERTCRVVSSRWEDEGGCDILLTELSCGHTVRGFCTPRYCGDCGARVVDHGAH